MGDRALTTRYVRALLATLPAEHVEPAQEAVCEAAQLWAASADLRRFMLNPLIPVEEKQQAMARLAERAGWPEPVRHFLGVLVENERAALLPEVSPVLADMIRARMRRQIAVIESPVPLSDEETAKIAHRLGTRLGVTLIPEATVQPGLLGGVRVRVADTLFDASVAGNLRALREQLTKG